MESILQSVKKQLGITDDYTHFDSDIVMHINSVFMILNQLGLGPPAGFSITGPDETWKSFFGEIPETTAVKTYVGLKVRLMFDPPTASSSMEAMNRLISELEWRLNAAVDKEESK